MEEAARYGLYDLDRIERMILRRIAVRERLAAAAPGTSQDRCS